MRKIILAIILTAVGRYRKCFVFLPVKARNAVLLKESLLFRKPPCIFFVLFV